MNENITPTPQQYMRMLNMIIAHSTNDDDKAWAEMVLEQILINEHTEVKV